MTPKSKHSHFTVHDDLKNLHMTYGRIWCEIVR